MDILVAWINKTNALPLSGCYVADYLNTSKTTLGIDIRKVHMSFASPREVEGGYHFELILRGQCTYTLSSAMAEFIDLKLSPFSTRIIAVKGVPAMSYYYRWNVYASRYQDKAPVVAYPLGAYLVRGRTVV